MAARGEESDLLRPMDLRPVRAGIEPAILGIAGDAVGTGADIAPAVILVPDRRGEFGDVDIVAGQDVLEHRPVLDDFVLFDLLVLHEAFAIGVRQLPLGQVFGKPERHVAPRAGEHVHQQTEALGAAGYLVEHDAGAVFLAQHRLGSETDILFPACAVYIFDLAQPVGQNQPFAQILIGDVAGYIAARNAIHLCLPDLEVPACCMAAARGASAARANANPAVCRAYPSSRRSFAAVPPRMAMRSSSVSSGVFITRSISVLVQPNG